MKVQTASSSGWGKGEGKLRHLCSDGKKELIYPLGLFLPPSRACRKSESMI